MPPSVFGIVIFAALLHAGWNAIVKASGDKMLSAAGVVGAAALIAGAAVPFAGLPSPRSWAFILGSVALQSLYLRLLAHAYHVANMSRVYPLMRGTAPLIVTAFGALFLGEHLSIVSLAGVAAVSLGILAMMMEGRGVEDGRGQGTALLNAVVIAGYTLVDGVGVRASDAPVAYILWTFVLNGMVFAGWMLATRPGAFRRHCAANWRSALAGGFGTLASYGLALWAMTKAPVATVAALRETAILFGLLIAVLLLKERIGPWRIAGAIAITSGAGLLRFG